MLIIITLNVLVGSVLLKDSDNEHSQPPSKMTHSTSGHPSTNERGVLEEDCCMESRGKGSYRRMNP